MSEKQRFEYNYKTGRICDNESDFQCTSNMGHIVRRLNDIDKKCKKLESDSEELSETNRMLSMKMSEIYTKYCLLKEFSEDTNPNEAVKTVLNELMQITKKYRNVSTK